MYLLFFLQPVRIDLNYTKLLSVKFLFNKHKGKSTHNKIRERSELKSAAMQNSYFISFFYLNEPSQRVAIAKKTQTSHSLQPKWPHTFWWNFRCLLSNLLAKKKDQRRSASTGGGAYFQARKSQQKADIKKVATWKYYDITVFLCYMRSEN